MKKFERIMLILWLFLGLFPYCSNANAADSDFMNTNARIDGVWWQSAYTRNVQSLVLLGMIEVLNDHSQELGGSAAMIICMNKKGFTRKNGRYDDSDPKFQKAFGTCFETKAVKSTEFFKPLSVYVNEITNFYKIYPKALTVQVDDLLVDCLNDAAWDDRGSCESKWATIFSGLFGQCKAAAERGDKEQWDKLNCKKNYSWLIQ
jgi:hypothetical protein